MRERSHLYAMKFHASACWLNTNTTKNGFLFFVFLKGTTRREERENMTMDGQALVVDPEQDPEQDRGQVHGKARVVARDPTHPTTDLVPEVGEADRNQEEDHHHESQLDHCQESLLVQNHEKLYVQDHASQVGQDHASQADQDHASHVDHNHVSQVDQDQEKNHQRKRKKRKKFPKQKEDSIKNFHSLLEPSARTLIVRNQCTSLSTRVLATTTPATANNK